MSFWSQFPWRPPAPLCIPAVLFSLLGLEQAMPATTPGPLHSLFLLFTQPVPLDIRIRKAGPSASSPSPIIFAVPAVRSSLVLPFWTAIPALSTLLSLPWVVFLPGT